MAPENVNLWVQPSKECLYQKIAIVDVLVSKKFFKKFKKPILFAQMCFSKENPYWFVHPISLITPVVLLKFTGTSSSQSSYRSDAAASNI